VTSPHFVTVPYLVASSDLIACVPEGLARRFQKILPLRICKLPFSMPLFHLRLAWHERNDDDPAHLWFRRLILKSVETS
jgi:DNA-binding transcriptional LysR family regulator